MADEEDEGVEDYGDDEVGAADASTGYEGVTPTMAPRTKAVGTKAARTKAAGTKAARTKAARTKAAGTKAAGNQAPPTRDEYPAVPSDIFNTITGGDAAANTNNQHNMLRVLQGLITTGLVNGVVSVYRAVDWLGAPAERKGAPNNLTKNRSCIQYRVFAPRLDLARDMDKYARDEKTGLWMSVHEYYRCWLAEHAPCYTLRQQDLAHTGGLKIQLPAGNEVLAETAAGWVMNPLIYVHLAKTGVNIKNGSKTKARDVLERFDRDDVTMLNHPRFEQGNVHGHAGGAGYLVRTVAATDKKFDNVRAWAGASISAAEFDALDAPPAPPPPAAAPDEPPGADQPIAQPPAAPGDDSEDAEVLEFTWVDDDGDVVDMDYPSESEIESGAESAAEEEEEEDVARRRKPSRRPEVCVKRRKKNLPDAERRATGKDSYLYALIAVYDENGPVMKQLLHLCDRHDVMVTNEREGKGGHSRRKNGPKLRAGEVSRGATKYVVVAFVKDPRPDPDPEKQLKFMLMVEHRYLNEPEMLKFRLPYLRGDEYYHVPHVETWTRVAKDAMRRAMDWGIAQRMQAAER